MTTRWLLTTVCIGALAATALAQSSNEEVARRQLESGRSFARQGNYTEALKDFRAVAETHASSAVADDALLEIARYYIDVADDRVAAAEAVDAIVKKYATSDSAPEAYLLAGRLALARGRQSADLDEALANFERVFRLFPTSRVVPRALTLGGETLLYARRPEDALGNLGRVIAEYPTDPSAAEAYLMLGRALVTLGEPVLAMEELQQVSNRWPESVAAKIALAQTTALHRLHVRARNGAAFALSAETIGPAKLANVVGLAFSSRPTLHFATESGLGFAPQGTDERVISVAKPRGVVTDRAGRVVAFDADSLYGVAAAAVPLTVAQPAGAPKALTNVQAVVQFTNGDWLVADGDDRSMHRYSPTGTYIGAFAGGRMSHLAITDADHVAGVDRDQRAVVVFDGAGQLITRIPLRAAGYDLQDIEDVAFDAFGHLYVLDRNAIAVFTPHPVPGAPAAAGYRLLTTYSPPQNDPAGFRRATAMALDPSGAVFLYDERLARVMVYR
jgi:TolA-binding protein